MVLSNSSPVVYEEGTEQRVNSDVQKQEVERNEAVARGMLDSMKISNTGASVVRLPLETVDESRSTSQTQDNEVESRFMEAEHLGSALNINSDSPAESRSIFDSQRFGSSSRQNVAGDIIGNSSNQHDTSAELQSALQPIPIRRTGSHNSSLSIMSEASKQSAALSQSSTASTPRTPKRMSRKKSFVRLIKRKSGIKSYDKGGKTEDVKGGENEPPAENIGLKLALPSTMDIMTGKEPPPPPLDRSPSKRKHNDAVGEEFSSSTIGNSANRHQNETASKEKMLITNSDNSANVKSGIVDEKSGVTNEEIVLRSCEMYPSNHQIAIPPAEDFLMHARICAMMENYSNILLLTRNPDSFFDFRLLRGRSRIELEGMYTRVLNCRDLRASNSVDAVNQSISTAGDAAQMAQTDQNDVQPSVLKSLLECAEDLVVEGYFSGKDECGSVDLVGRQVDVTVFSSQRHRQFVVCYRGSHMEQDKPVSRKKTKAMGTTAEIMLHSNHPVPVFRTFREKYFENDMENRVFELVHKLSGEYPFCDLVTTGHSFGGALAIIAATRYAALFPMMTVSCHTFGTPKPGGVLFRQLAHSLPNLKVMRVEHGDDPYVHFPEGGKWTHVGHTITIETDESALGLSGVDPGSIRLASQRTSAKAYRFDARRPYKGHFKASMGGKTKKMRKDKQIRAYANAIEHFTHLGIPWVTNYVGEEGGDMNGAAYA